MGNSEQQNGAVATANRRTFLAGAATAVAVTIIKPELVRGSAANSKIRIGVVGQGGRGHWISGLFAKHGGYQITGVADYFPEVAAEKGKALGVAESHCFSGLSGYKRLIASGVDALVLETPPYFFPEHAQAAVDAGKHVYMAKPAAVDVPGALQVEAAAKKAEPNKNLFMVDYQITNDPINVEVAKRVRDGALGKITYVKTTGIGIIWPDPPLTATIESRLHKDVWLSDIALGGDYIVNYDIHAIDAAVWVLGRRPLSAMGHSRRVRPNPHGDAHEVTSLVYEFEDGLYMNHLGHSSWVHDYTQADTLCCRLYGIAAMAQIPCGGKAFLKGGKQHYTGGEVANNYLAGAERNIAAFHDKITKGDFNNEDNIKHSIDSVLTCILGREAGARGEKMTMEQLLKENKKLTVNLAGLKD